VSVIIHTNAVVYPWAMATNVLATAAGLWIEKSSLLVMLCDTSIASFAMLASEWHPYHTCDAKVLIVEFP
jgi:hypothetical protein